MGDVVCIDPRNHAGVHICDLKEVVNLRAAGSNAASIQAWKEKFQSRTTRF